MTVDTRSDAGGRTTGEVVLRPRLRRLDLGSTAPGDIAERATLLRRSAVPDEQIRSAVRTTLESIRVGGSEAVRAANRRFGGGSSNGGLLIERPTLAAARDELDPVTRRALDQAIVHVRRFAETQLPTTSRVTIAPGIEIERRWLPLDRVGCYVPGGSAPYPSSLVMTVVPAIVAGVRHVVVATPADENGSVHPVLLGAAGLLEVDAVLVAGGAQAVAALAFGLAGQASVAAPQDDEALEPVDRIVGPGNAWVTAAKLEVAGVVGIDLPAGPSEGMVLADATADPVTVAADLVTQAEHGPDSPAILVTTSECLADAVDEEIARLVPQLERAAILGHSLETHGRVILAPTLDEAIAFVDAYAPEHLSIDVADAEIAASLVRHAGSIFVGRWAPESAGDYATGANHVLPTGGLARSSDALSVEQFGRYTQIQRVDEDGLAGIRQTVATLATVEGLTAHRHAVEVR
ncbi:MAG TPA: histidinol dehydrogenase, partial [Candidatus Limnocylindrales bacterium]|nr:histidinol dehydrogenase [Candidatus Limnocylindrales bacterium]